MCAAGSGRDRGLTLGEREVHRSDPLSRVALLEQIANANAQVAAVQQSALRRGRHQVRTRHTGTSIMCLRYLLLSH